MRTFFLLFLMSTSTFAIGNSRVRAFAEMKGGCGNFKVNLLKEAALWKENAPLVKAAVDPASAVSIVIDKKLAIELNNSTVKFLTPPEKKFSTKGKAYAGILKIKANADGGFRVSLGDKVWVDVVDVEAKKELKADSFEMQTECDSIFKVVDYSLKSGKEYLVQISSSTEKQIDMIISKIEY